MVPMPPVDDITREVKELLELFAHNVGPFPSGSAIAGLTSDDDVLSHICSA